MRYLLTAMLIILFAIALFAQSSSKEKHITIETKLSADRIPSGENVNIAIMLNINEGWHVNSHTPTFDYLIPTLFELQSKEYMILADVQYPKGKSAAFSFAEKPIDVYEGSVIVFASIKTSKNIVIGFDTIKASLTYQACNNQICLAPATVDISIPIEIASNSMQVIMQNQELFKDYNQVIKNSDGNDNDLASMFEEQGLTLTFLAIFLIGLALNLTPCVYPMLSVTVSLFGSQTETRAIRVFFKALIYVLGIATMYSILGVSAALGGGLFGSWLQSSWVLGAIAALLFGLALSSFGLYQIQLPFWLTSRLGGTAGSGFIAIYLSGLVVGVFAAPCVGPPVIALLTLVAAKGSITFGFWSFFILALGLGFPYLILGTFSGLIKKIPRSGLWLVWVEKIFGVILIGAALFYLALAVAPKLAVYVISLILIIGGAYLGFIDKSGRDRLILKRIQWIAGILSIILGLIILNNLREKGIAWEEYSEDILVEAVENKAPVILDFYADWCIPCIELDRNTWTNAEAIKATENMRRVKIDLTHFDSPDSEALRKKFNISGVPTIIFIRNDGTEATESRIVGFVSASDFLAKLNLAFQSDN